MKIVGNEVLLRAFVAHHDKFKDEHKSDDGNSLNVSSMLLAMVLAHDGWIVLQDAPLWFHCCKNHWKTKQITSCIHREKDDEMKKRIKTFTLNEMKNIKILQEGHELSRSQNITRE